jgi:phage-related tail protein
MFDSAPPPPAYATGVDHAPGGVSLVGETGPELVNLPEGAGVIPAGPSRDLLFGQNAAIDFGSVPDLSGASGGSSMQMVDEFRQMRQEMSQWQSTFRVENVQTDYDEFDERQQANLARVKNVKLAARGTALVN